MSLGSGVVGARPPLVRGAGCGPRSAVGRSGLRTGSAGRRPARRAAGGGWCLGLRWRCRGGGGRPRAAAAGFLCRAARCSSAGVCRPAGDGGACRGGRFIVWSTVPGFCLRKLRLVLTIGSEAVS